MEHIKIIEKIEEGAHHFLHCIKIEYEDTKDAGKIVEKYLKGEKLTPEDEHVLKLQLVDSLKMVGVMVPFVLVPGASIIMPILIKVASKHNIELMPSAFNEKEPEAKTGEPAAPKTAVISGPETSTPA